jgi:hypothetical protein
MLVQIILTVVLVPMLCGMAISALGAGSSIRPVALTAFLLPLTAALASVMIEGFPALPPVAAKQKLPVILSAAGLVFAFLAVAVKDRAGRSVVAAVTVLSLAAPAWWLGRNVLAANQTKAITLAVVLVIIAVELYLVSIRKSRTEQPASLSLPAAVLASVIATAITALSGGYIGMGQMSGAVAAVVGGWILVRFVAFLRGNDSAFRTSGMSAFAFVWTGAAMIMMTVLFAPAASTSALAFSVLPVAAFLLFRNASVGFERQPRFLRPLISGALMAAPAIVAIALAVIAQA